MPDVKWDVSCDGMRSLYAFSVDKHMVTDVVDTSFDTSEDGCTTTNVCCYWSFRFVHDTRGGVQSSGISALVFSGRYTPSSGLELSVTRCQILMIGFSLELDADC